MIIKIICGTFGHRQPSGAVRAVTSSDGPIIVADAIGERLIKKGVAQEVAAEPKKATTPPPHSTPQVEAQKQPEKEKANSKMTRAELEAMAKKLGIAGSKIKSATKKSALIAIINSKMDAVKDAETAPVFDASEALQ